MTRDEVIKALEICAVEYRKCDGCPLFKKFWCKDILYEEVMALIKAGPKQGRWEVETKAYWTGKFEENGDPEYKPYPIYHCSECGRATISREKYCPTCGAKMGEDDSNDER